jgi:hypothetical protein
MVTEFLPLLKVHNKNEGKEIKVENLSSQRANLYFWLIFIPNYKIKIKVMQLNDGKHMN